VKNNFGIYDQSFFLILETIQEIPEIEKAILFGSRAMGNYKKGSDIDIAIVGNNVTGQIKTRLSSILNQELPIPYFIDVLDYNTIINENLIAHIDAEGKVIYTKEI
jgi:predicted nucleotidyltransferase